MESGFDRFVEEMNIFAESLSLSKSKFVNPSGLICGKNGNLSTSRNLAHLCAKAASSRTIRNIWQHKRWTVGIGTENKIINSTFGISSKSLTSRYNVIGGKTGSGNKEHYTLVCIAEINGVEVVGAVMEAISKEGRFTAMEQLFDIANQVLYGKKVKNKVVDAEAAYAMRVDNSECLYAQNADTIFPSMSTSKLLTAIVVLKYVRDLDERITIEESDLVGTEGTSGSIFNGGEEVTIRDLLYCLLLPSSNQAANALARHVGKTIMKNKKQ